MKRNTRLIPISQALLVTFLWSTSFIIIKWGLVEIPPVSFAGIRYFIAFLFFVPWVFIKSSYRTELISLNKSDIKRLITLGIIFYSITQGAQFLGLYYLPSVTVSLMLNFTPIIVAIAGIFFLSEKPTILQWIGVIGFVLGIIFYFYSANFNGGKIIGVIIMVAGVLANSVSALLGRSINREAKISPIIVTFVSMGIGSLIMLIVGLILNGIPQISLKTFGYIIWLSLINTTVAFTIWNHTLRNLTAMESSIINGTMLIQLAILAWFFLGEEITIMEGLGMLIAAISALLVQIKKWK